MLGHVDSDCAALVQAVRRTGLQPQLCASPWQAAQVAQARGAALVVVQASAIDMSPRRLLEALRRLGPLRVALCGPEPGGLLHALALDVGFDEVWPQPLRGAVLEATLCRAWQGTPPAAPAPVVVNLTSSSCRVAGRAHLRVRAVRGVATSRCWKPRPLRSWRARPRSSAGRWRRRCRHRFRHR